MLEISKKAFSKETLLWGKKNTLIVKKKEMILKVH